ncbi:MAG: hypothetical protein ACREOO_05475 [bacterium]
MSSVPNPDSFRSGFTTRTNKSLKLMQTVEKTIFTPENYFHIPTGIEHRFGEQAGRVHELLYRSMGPTTDLLRYFPDSLYLDRRRRWPTWETNREQPERMARAADEKSTGLFAFFVEYKYSDAERKAALSNVPTKYIGIIEREAWLTYKRLTSTNPGLGIYLDSQRSRIALFYAATYAPDKLYAGWEEWLEPIADERAVRKDLARPNERTVGFSTGSGTPWMNFDIRRLKPLERFLSEELFWDETKAQAAVQTCKHELFSTR